MFEEIIEKINPKPKFNLSYYNDVDLYSDGDIENTILKIISENEPENYVEAIGKNFCWPVYYHLSQIRRNILNWYPFDEGGSALEIGCGMGAITGLLCEKCADVTSVELSKRRAVSTLLRCREKENLEIIVGNLNDIKFDKKYDYITLIGVLEYQCTYTDSENPFVDFLKKIKKLLKPKGKLLIAIENRFGLKYWCGAKEDHVGIPFESINNYCFSGKRARTFSRYALSEIVLKSGFEDVFFYYPLPDYKLPNVIYSEKMLPGNDIQNLRYYYIPNSKTLVADERSIYDEVIKNDVFEFFSNSFLVECGPKEDLGEIIYAKLNSVRGREYQTGIRFTRNNIVERFGLWKGMADSHFQNIIDYENRLARQGIRVSKSKYSNGILSSEYIMGEKLEVILEKAYNSRNIEEIYLLWDRLYSDILFSSPEIDWKNNILYTFDMNIVPNKEKYGVILENGYVDMIAQNAFLDEKDTFIWFDQEWMLENVPAKFILFRALNYFYCSRAELATILSHQILARKYGLLEVWGEFQYLERIFQNIVCDQMLLKQDNSFRGTPKADIVTNIKKLRGDK